ncbi:hypothetical protein MNBD_GAMMA17-1845 [hydrothermal vent metagenome]|uniref:Uncharacterized protein n=1 Tax=hydrothermal vent metagenome TaxID=652676 RepID=A0A3B1AAZ0_9ZZZZ
MTDAAKEPSKEPEKQDLYFSVNSENALENEQAWYQDNLDTVMPLLIIAVGLFQFLLRKWILPLSDEVISKLENQFPTQGLIYMPEFGLALIIFGSILLLVFNI